MALNDDLRQLKADLDALNPTLATTLEIRRGLREVNQADIDAAASLPAAFAPPTVPAAPAVPPLAGPSGLVSSGAGSGDEVSGGGSRTGPRFLHGGGGQIIPEGKWFELNCSLVKLPGGDIWDCNAVLGFGPGDRRGIFRIGDGPGGAALVSSHGGDASAPAGGPITATPAALAARPIPPAPDVPTRGELQIVAAIRELTAATTDTLRRDRSGLSVRQQRL